MSAVTQTRAAGWQASLRLDFERAGAKTVMRRRHSGPLLVQRPFYPDGETCHAVVLHPPAGIVGGDQLDVEVHCHQQAGALVTTPGATRFYGSDGRVAQQQQHVHITGGSVEWLPQETIYFDRCLARQELLINLDHNSRFIGWDINCFGRPAGDQLFVSGEAVIALRVLIDGLPVLQERLVVDAAESENLNENKGTSLLSGLQGATVSATMLVVAPALDAQHWLPLARDALVLSDQAKGQFAATQIDSVLAVRYLGNSAETARYVFTKVWRALRPLVMQKDVVIPRLWAT